MASVNEIAIRTSIAAVHNGSHLRVYETDIEGKIRETQYEGKWTGGTSSNVIGSGRIGTPVSATSLGLSNIRVYFIGADSKVHESCYDSGHSWVRSLFCADMGLFQCSLTQVLTSYPIVQRCLN